MDELRYQETEHTADWALAVRGSTLDELFRSAAQGMLSLIGAAPKQVEPDLRELELRANDLESLLVSWLEEILFRIEVHHILAQDFEVHVEPPGHLTASVREAPLDRLERPIKAVTFHDLAIERDDGGYRVAIVFDV